LAARLLVVCLAVALSGCASLVGTFAKPPEDGNLVYVGTRGRFKQLTFQEDTDGIGGLALLLGWPFFAIDLPFCVAADTLLLPYTMTVSRKE
jgi:uncharacterized protein YceK